MFARLAKIMQRRDATATAAFREWSNSWRNRNWATSNRKYYPAFAAPFSAFRPYFSPNLHPILGVPVRRLWK